MLKKILIFASAILCLAALTCAAEGANAVSVRFEHIYTDSHEYAVLTAEAESGSELWSRTTESYECAQLDAVCELAANGGAYYYVEGGAVVALNLADGTELWRNADFGGSASGFAFGEDGTLYVCGYYGPDFFAVDADGNTLAMIDMLEEELYWPYEMQYLGDRIAITFEGSDGSGEAVTLYVNLADYSCSRE